MGPQLKLESADLAILLHYHCCSWPHEMAGNIHGETSINKLILNDLLVKRPEPDHSNGYNTTPRAAALIELFLKTPLPEQRWLDHNGKIIKIERKENNGKLTGGS